MAELLQTTTSTTCQLPQICPFPPWHHFRCTGRIGMLKTPVENVFQSLYCRWHSNKSSLGVLCTKPTKGIWHGPAENWGLISTTWGFFMCNRDIGNTFSTVSLRPIAGTSARIRTRHLVIHGPTLSLGATVPPTARRDVAGDVLGEDAELCSPPLPPGRVDTQRSQSPGRSLSPGSRRRPWRSSCNQCPGIPCAKQT